MWSGALSKGGVAAVLANLEESEQTVTLHAEQRHMPRRRAGAAKRWDIVDAYSGASVCAGCTLPRSARVGAHDVAFWVLSPASD